MRRVSVSSDLEPRASQALDGDRAQPSAEQAMRTTIIKSVAVSVPVAIGIFVGLVALALRNQQPNWGAYLAMAAGIGVIAGIFFGLLMGFTLTSHNFE